MEINWKDFEKVDLRVGQIVRTENFPEAKKPAFKLWVDFGSLGVKRSSAQITEQYSTEKLVGKWVVGVVNFSPKQIGPFISECLILGVYTPKGVILVTPDGAVSPGSRIG